MAAALLGAAIVGGASSAAAEDWPSKPVTIIVPYGPGAANDIYTRAAANILSKNLKQPFVVDNRPGAGGFTGTMLGARAAPDGYTLFENSNAITSMGQGNAEVKFDPSKDIVSIALLEASSQALFVSTASGINTVPDLVAYAKAHPDETFYGVVGYGTYQHLQTEAFNSVVGIKTKVSVYNSGAAVMTDLAAGRIQMAFGSINTAIGLIQDGKIKVLGYTGPSQGDAIPPGPIFKDAGVDFAYTAWQGIFGPPGMPQELRDQINKAFNEATQNPEYVALAKKGNAAPIAMNVKEFDDLVQKDVKTVNALIQQTGITPQ